MDTEQSTENQNLEETPSAGKSAFSDDAIAAISEQRSLKQAALLRAERAEGVAEGLRAVEAKAVPPAVSPLDAEIARQTAEGIGEEDMTISPTIYRKHERWKDQVANKKAADDVKAAKDTVINKSTEAAKQKHADWMDVVTAGQVHLTKGELVDLEDAGVDFGENAYKQCKAASERAKPKTDSSAPKTESGEPKKETKDETVPTQDEILAGVDPAIATVANM